MGDLIHFIILIVFALFWFVFSFFQFKEKGFLFNNAYIYASEKERKTMNKKPYYKQTAVVFLLIGLIFLINAAEVALNTGWLFILVIIMAFVTVFYAVISSILIEKNK